MKRFSDIAISTISLLVFAIPIVLIAIMVRKNLGAPIIFRQTRPGLNGKPFTMIKFRTMRNITNVNGKLLHDVDRLTNFGKWLRATSLDELPELWNVLRGDMSIVGPRPLLMEYLPLYSHEHYRRHELRPGITGWAQVKGRNEISWEEKFKFDLWYVDNHSTLVDIKIIWMTLNIVITQKGITASNYATMPKFTGLEKNKE